MDSTAIIDAARAQTGLNDFGVDSWREGFEVLVRSFNEEAALNATGEQVVIDSLTKILRNRLGIEEWFRRHPEISEQPISPPLFGLGLPRTGSTALGAMLALDPAHRSLRTWEADQPSPPPETATEHTDPRIAESEARIAAQAQMFPEFVGMLPTSAIGPTECSVLLTLDFRTGYFAGTGRIPTYCEWVLHCDMEPAYRYHRRVLQLLQWRCPPTDWWLRTPGHTHALIELDRVYPGSRFVMTHRDIASVIPSAAALRSALSASITEAPDPYYLGRNVTSTWEVCLHRLIAFRDAGNEGRFFDIDFMEMQTEPIDAIRRLYTWLGRDFSAEAEKRMTTWWREHAEKRQPPSKRYRAEDYGIDLDELRERFAFYTERFDLSARKTRTPA